MDLQGNSSPAPLLFSPLVEFSPAQFFHTVFLDFPDFKKHFFSVNLFAYLAYSVNKLKKKGAEIGHRKYVNVGHAEKLLSMYTDRHVYTYSKIFDQTF